MTEAAEAYLDESRDPDADWRRKTYVLDALLLGTANEVCDYPPSALRYRAKNLFLPGIATLSDSIAVLDELVFGGDVPYREMIAMLDADFVGYDGDDVFETAKECRFGLIQKDGKWQLDEKLLSGGKAFFEMV